MNHKILLLLLFLVTTNAWSSVSIDQTPREIINAHAAYVNICTNHIAAMNRGLSNFNYDLDKSVTALQEGYTQRIRYLKHTYMGYLGYSYTPTQLDSVYTSIEVQRAHIDINAQKKLDDFFNKYQRLIHETNMNFNAIKNLAGDGSRTFSPAEITKGYELLTAIELKIKLLTLQNVTFSKLSIDLFEEEKLPLILQRTKDWVTTSQQIISQIRNKDLESLKESIAQHQKLAEIRYEEADFRNLEKFGNYKYTGYKNMAERQNIRRVSMDVTEEAIRYLNGQSAANYTLKRYTRQFSFEQSVISLFHDSGLKLCRRYNETIQRAHVPVLLMVQEVFPYKVFYSEGYEPKRAVATIDSKKIPSEVSKEQEVRNQSEIVPELVATPAFIEDDLTTLNGASINNLVLLLDVSASMRRNNNLEKLKTSINTLVDILRPDDQLTVITYSGTVQKVLETSTRYEKKYLKTIIEELKSNGRTNANAGLEMAYESCRSTFLDGGNNRIIIASDGDFQISTAMNKHITDQAKNDIYLSTFHYFSQKPKVENILNKLAQTGRGTYLKITNQKDAISALIKESKKQIIK